MSMLLTPEDVADRLRVKVGTLAAWRWRGIGPAWIKVGGVVRYPGDKLESWLAQRPNGSSESDSA